MLKSYVDSTWQYARITTFMRDIGTDKMQKLKNVYKIKSITFFQKNATKFH